MTSKNSPAAQRKKGFILLECLLALLLSAVFLPLLVTTLAENLQSASLLRRREEAWRSAVSVMELTAALRRVPDQAELKGLLSSQWGRYEASVRLEADGSCRVQLLWTESGIEKKIVLRRRLETL